MKNKDRHDYNTELRQACKEGHIEVVKSLLFHPDPKTRSLINLQVQINAAITAAINNNHCEIALLLKANYPKQYKHYMGPENEEIINDNIYNLSIIGGVEGVELLLAEIPSNMKLDLVAILARTLEHNQPKVFDSLIHYKNPATPSKEMVDYFLRVALVFERFSQLKEIKSVIEKFNFNFFTIIDTRFNSLMGECPKSLIYLVQNFSYTPSKELRLKIEKSLNSPNFGTSDLNLKNFMDCLKAKEEKAQLEKHISPLSQNTVITNKV